MYLRNVYQSNNVPNQLSFHLQLSLRYQDSVKTQQFQLGLFYYLKIIILCLPEVVGYRMQWQTQFHEPENAEVKNDSLPMNMKVTQRALS